MTKSGAVYLLVRYLKAKTNTHVNLFKEVCEGSHSLPYCEPRLKQWLRDVGHEDLANSIPDYHKKGEPGYPEWKQFVKSELEQPEATGLAMNDDGSIQVGGGAGSIQVGGGAGSIQVGGGDGSIQVGGGDGSIQVGGGDGSIQVGGGAGSIQVGGGDGSIRVSGGDGSIQVGGGDGSIQVGGGDGSIRVAGGDGSIQVAGGDGSIQVGGGDGSIRVGGGDGSIHGGTHGPSCPAHRIVKRPLESSDESPPRKMLQIAIATLQHDLALFENVLYNTPANSPEERFWGELMCKRTMQFAADLSARELEVSSAELELLTEVACARPAHYFLASCCAMAQRLWLRSGIGESRPPPPGCRRRRRRRPAPGARPTRTHAAASSLIKGQGLVLVFLKLCRRKEMIQSATS